MSTIGFCTSTGNRFFVRPYARRWLVVERGVRIIAEYGSRSKAERVARYLSGDVPAMTDPLWDRLAADLGLAVTEGAS